MLSELPKLFGKSFAIGFLLPATAIGAALLALLTVFEIETPVIAILKEKDVLGASLALVVLWFFGVVLMALNRPIIRLLEGYGTLNPFNLKFGWERSVFNGLKAEVATTNRLIAAAVAANREPDQSIKDRKRKALLKLRRDFPHEEGFLLPTRFGNVIRAFEVYSTVIYGLEGIDGWSRLVAVVPADYRDAIEQAKAQMDFWANLWVGSILCVAVYVYLALWSGTCAEPWIPLVAIVCAFVAIAGAREMARGWGMLVKSAFDLFRGDLCKKLGLAMPRSIEKEREMWAVMSQTMVYRSKPAATKLTQHRVHEER